MALHGSPRLTRRLWAGLAALCLFALAPAAASSAAYVDHLELIGFDKVQEDDRFNTLTGAGATIAVFDTGTDTEHLMFEGRQMTGANFASDEAPLFTEDTPFRDGQGHGSHVASVATGNPVMLEHGPGLSGIAPGADIATARVLNNEGSGAFSDIIEGLDWAIEQVEQGQDIRVINMSLGTTDTFVEEPTGQLPADFNERVATLREMGIPIVAASGNSGDQQGLSFPAILSEVMAIGSSNANDEVSFFTNRSKNLALLAPGEQVWGASAMIEEGDPNNAATALTGTSMAAPQVAGSILLIQELAEREWGRLATVDELHDILTFTGVEVTDEDLAFPRLDLHTALDYTYAIPEPGTALLLLGGGMALLLRRRAA